jgi:8-oxo-dGTP pyrophosphatase MutT (NUDIX family)
LKTGLESFEQLKLEESRVRKKLFDFVGTIILNQDRSKVLATIRKKDGNVGLPGGKMEPGERPIDTARRETLEETGFVVEIDENYLIMGKVVRPNRKDVSVGLYIAKIVAVRIDVQPDENVAWVDMDTLSRSPYGECNINAVRTAKLLLGDI